MENEMVKESIANEAVQEVATQVAAPSKGNGLKNVAIVGGIMALGALAWELGVKPVGRKIGSAIRKAKDRRKEKAAETGDENTEDMDDPEKEYPIG